MPRRARVVIPGVPHHITQRGNNRQLVFLSPGERRCYLDLLVRRSPGFGTRILAYCLMGNHVHLIAIPQAEDSLARILGRAHSEFALAVNRGQGCSGHLWQGRFFSCPMDEEHLRAAMRYVELNPVRAKLAATAWEYAWSSARTHIEDEVLDPVLADDWKTYFEGWDFGEWKAALSEGLVDAEVEAVRRATRTGEPLGSREFLLELERRQGKRLTVGERGRPRRLPQSEEEEARQGGLFG
jgi:putative transposase